jgi:hypothetical protein
MKFETNNGNARTRTSGITEKIGRTRGMFTTQERCCPPQISEAGAQLRSYPHLASVAAPISILSSRLASCCTAPRRPPLTMGIAVSSAHPPLGGSSARAASFPGRRGAQGQHAEAKRWRRRTRVRAPSTAPRRRALRRRELPLRLGGVLT